MALYPCDIGAHRYAGPQQTIYPALVSGGWSDRRKLRLCPTHFDALLETCEERCIDANDTAGPPPQLGCVSCGAFDTPISFGFYATVYPMRQERRDFWGSVHEKCASAFCADWGLDLSADIDPDQYPPQLAPMRPGQPR